MINNGRSLARDVALGGIAGAAATWAMGLTTTFMYDRESKSARRQEEAARRGKEAYAVAAHKAAAMLGRKLNKKQEERLGTAIHWGLGIAAGAVYGALRPRMPGLKSGKGATFGSTFWLLVDEAVSPALRLTPGPMKFPWQAHARGLTGHVVFGVVADAVLNLADRIQR